jgi:hypothetical protein
MAWDTGTFENGQYTVRVKADDAAGNVRIEEAQVQVLNP